MAEFKISVDLSQVMNAVPIINRQVFPLVNQAVRAIAQQTSANWQKAVYKAKLWSGERDSYAASIKWEMTSDFSAVVSTDYKNAEGIEQGRPAYDMKRALDTSPKVRRTKDGRRFLVIPMRHNIPGQNALEQGMPQYVYDLASQLSPSKIVAQAKRASGEMTSVHPAHGMRALKRQTPFLSNPKTRSTFMVPKNIYKWGEKLPGMALANRADERKYGNMYRFDTSTPGGGRHSSFLTFRIMMDGQQGWILPAQPGQYLAKKVADKMQPKAEKVMNEAVKQSFG